VEPFADLPDAPTPGSSSTTSIPRLRSAFASPAPESIRSFGLLMAPAARITSWSAAISFTVPSVIILTPTQRVPLKFSFTTLVLSRRVRFGFDSAGRRKRIRNANAVDLVIGHLLQPIPVEAKPHIVVQLAGSRVVDMKGLPRLQVTDSEPRKRIVIG